MTCRNCPFLSPVTTLPRASPFLWFGFLRGNSNVSAFFCAWGLIPSWAADPKIGHRLINARSETVATKPAFRAAFKQRRCLVPADGFYEWKLVDRKKQPYLTGVGEGQPIAFAGLWEKWEHDGRAGSTSIR